MSFPMLLAYSVYENDNKQFYNLTQFYNLI